MLLMYNKEFSGLDIEQTPEMINTISENLSRHLVMAAKPYEKQVINHGDERYVYEVYGRAMTNLLNETKKQLSYIQTKK
jgi:hypothetical protein